MRKTVANDPGDTRNPPQKVPVLKLILNDIANLQKALRVLEKRVESLLPKPPKAKRVKAP